MARQRAPRLPSSLAYRVHITLIHWGGDTRLAAAGYAFYVALAELCESSYGRAVLSVWGSRRARRAPKPLFPRLQQRM
jgi:hypothetical protein